MYKIGLIINRFKKTNSVIKTRIIFMLTDSFTRAKYKLNFTDRHISFTYAHQLIYNLLYYDESN